MGGIGSRPDGVCAAMLEPSRPSTLVHGSWVTILPILLQYTHVVALLQGGCTYTYMHVYLTIQCSGRLEHQVVCGGKC